MHQFETISGSQQKGCIPVLVKNEDGTYYKAIEIAKSTCKDYIMLFKKDDNKLTLLNPLDIIDEPICFVVVNINDRTLESCADDGLIDVAKWLRIYGCEWNNNIISNAALSGHIEFAKWARENGCPWCRNVISNAALNGHIEFAKWAHENGCPWGDDVISNAKYCQDWIKSKRLLDLEMYGSSTTDDTNLLVRFGCSVLAEFINYWFAYLCIHEDIALLYCDKSYYAELSKVFNEMVGVYKF